MTAEQFAQFFRNLAALEIQRRATLPRGRQQGQTEAARANGAAIVTPEMLVTASAELVRGERTSPIQIRWRSWLRDRMRDRRVNRLEFNGLLVVSMFSIKDDAEPITWDWHGMQEAKTERRGDATEVSLD